jgi:tetratricopeptide (TPR) repeat protein
LEARGQADSVAGFVARGIGAYRAGDYQHAALWLGRAHAQRNQPGIAYYRGLSLLLGEHADSATLAFRQVIESGSAAYGPEAHYYAAKAWLQLGRVDSARAYLTRVTVTREPIRTRTRFLLDSIQKIR